MMLLDTVQTKSLPSDLIAIIGKSLENIPRIAREGEPLENAQIDHIAIAVTNPRELRYYWQIATDNGATLVEPIHFWPDDLPNCVEVPEVEKKYICTLSVGNQLIVLLAPHDDKDLIAQFLIRSGGSSIHHFALAVDDVHAKLSECLALGYVRQVTVVAEDHDALTQVFLAIDGDTRLIELIKREKGFTGTFTCKNIAILSAGERIAFIGGSYEKQ